MKKPILKFIFALFCTLLLIPAVFAQTAPPIIPDQPDGTTPEELIIPHTNQTDAGIYFQSVYLPEITRVVITIAGAAAFLFIIIGGIQILTAYGDEEKITTAKKTITYAIIGLLVTLLSYAIVSIISGVQISNPDLGSQEWQDANKGLDDEQMNEKAELQEKYKDIPGSGDMSLEELQQME